MFSMSSLLVVIIIFLEISVVRTPFSIGFIGRKRTSRVTSGQLEILLSKLEANPQLFTIKFRGLQGKENFEKGWREVADELNQLPNGSVKTPEHWITVKFLSNNFPDLLLMAYTQIS
ncbi:unnamed protein product [Parnassius apollo]|uniref:(apollo) hypothetical protein n=1 Tax=Parnassius apollo TaxID=110799 RepID=A0A8S3Y1P1_PARAO|nr:unnamed protein product [Parnassius apollo]